MESRGMVGLSVKYCEPKRPSSSPVCQTKMIERFGLALAPANASAISSTAVVPDPSSSAPLKIESRRGGFSRCRLSTFTLICAACSGVTW